ASARAAAPAACICAARWGPGADGHAVGGAHRVAVSSEGKSVYATAEDNYRDSNSAVVRLNRNPTTGAISQPDFRAGCISETGAGPCAKGHGIGGRRDEVGGPVGGREGADGQGVS